MKKLLDEARAAKAPVVYSIIANTTTADVIKDVAPTAGEPFVRSGPDKFINTNLEKILKHKGISRDRNRDGTQRRSALYRGRRGTPRYERDRAGRRDVGSRPLC